MEVVQTHDQIIYYEFLVQIVIISRDTGLQNYVLTLKYQNYTILRTTHEETKR